MNYETEPVLIGQVVDIELDSVEHFEHDEIDYAIYRLASGFYATQGNCPCEENSLLSDGDINNEEIECPGCRKKFNIISGESVSESGFENLKICDVTIKDNDLYLNI